jgi:hypothetical protein
MHPHDTTVDPACFGIPAHMVADFESSYHNATRGSDVLAASKLNDSCLPSCVNESASNVI